MWFSKYDAPDQQSCVNVRLKQKPFALRAGQMSCIACSYIVANVGNIDQNYTF